MLARMYIRATRTRSTSTGEAYFTHRLVRTVRTDGKVRQQTSCVCQVVQICVMGKG